MVSKGNHPQMACVQTCTNMLSAAWVACEHVCWYVGRIINQNDPSWHLEAIMSMDMLWGKFTVSWKTLIMFEKFLAALDEWRGTNQQSPARPQRSCPVKCLVISPRTSEVQVQRVRSPKVHAWHCLKMAISQWYMMIHQIHHISWGLLSIYQLFWWPPCDPVCQPGGSATRIRMPSGDDGGNWSAIVEILAIKFGEETIKIYH